MSAVSNNVLMTSFWKYIIWSSHCYRMQWSLLGWSAMWRWIWCPTFWRMSLPPPSGIDEWHGHTLYLYPKSILSELSVLSHHEPQGEQRRRLHCFFFKVYRLCYKDCRLCYCTKGKKLYVKKWKVSFSSFLFTPKCFACSYLSLIKEISFRFNKSTIIPVLFSGHCFKSPLIIFFFLC